MGHQHVIVLVKEEIVLPAQGWIHADGLCLVVETTAPPGRRQAHLPAAGCRGRRRRHHAIAKSLQHATLVHPQKRRAKQLQIVAPVRDRKAQELVVAKNVRIRARRFKVERPRKGRGERHAVGRPIRQPPVSGLAHLHRKGCLVEESLGGRQMVPELHRMQIGRAIGQCDGLGQAGNLLFDEILLGRAEGWTIGYVGPFNVIIG